MVKLTESEQIIIDADISDLSLEKREIRRKIKQRITQENYRNKLKKQDQTSFLKNQREQKATSRIKIEKRLLEIAKTTKKDKTDIIDMRMNSIITVLG